MFDYDNILELILDNLKKFFIPGDWIELDLKFSKSEIFTVLFLDKRKEITMTELVDYINTPMSTATGIADRLVKSGYVKRERSESDRRIVVLGLTEEGSHLVKKLKATMSKYLSLVVDDLTEEEKQFMTRIVLKIMSNLQEKLNTQAAVNKDEESIKKIDIE